jgi:5-oxoprolinase (ATP-hydrolysing) subunit B
MSGAWRLEFLGDAALSIKPAADQPLEANAWVHRLAQRLREASVDGVRDIVPGMRELVVHVDPLRCDLRRVEAELRDSTRTDPVASEPLPTVLEIPVTYGGEAGPDLEDVARASGLTTDEVCRRHAGREYLVCFVGFLPGFPYLGVLHPSLRLPRRDTPRPRVPSGSVAIAGEYTGIYPSASPGGWHVIGHTAITLFDLASEPPARLAPGMRVKFVAERASGR